MTRQIECVYQVQLQVFGTGEASYTLEEEPNVKKKEIQPKSKLIREMDGWVPIATYSASPEDDVIEEGDEEANRALCPMQRALTTLSYHQYNTLDQLKLQGFRGVLRIAQFNFESVIKEVDYSSNVQVSSNRIRDKKMSKLLHRN